MHNGGHFVHASVLTHWGRVTHICFSDLIIIGSDNGLSPGRRQAIIRTNAVILLIRPLRTNFSEILIEIRIFSFKKMRLKVSSVKRQPFCLCLNVLSYKTIQNVVMETHRVRACSHGFMLVCSQSKWNTNRDINTHPTTRSLEIPWDFPTRSCRPSLKIVWSTGMS